jgi:hypothetical protein
MLYRIAAAALAAGLFTVLSLGGSSSAQEGDKPSAPPSVVHDDTRQIAVALDLIELGRATKAPELLISAARILHRIEPQKGDLTPEASNGTDQGGGEPPSFKTMAKDLFAEAVKLAPKKEAKAIAALVKQAEANDLVIPPPEKRNRESFGGPRSYFHQPGAGVVMTWRMKFIGGRPASVTVQGNGRNMLTLRVSGNDGVNLSWTSRNPALNWVPNRNAGYTVTVTNDGPGGAAYTLYHN